MSSPIPECPEIDDLLTCDLAVHLILRVKPSWDTARQAATAELEHKTQAAQAFADSPTFATRYGARIGVLRVQSATVAPSIVAHLLTEQGVELEQPDAERPPPGQGSTCHFCRRDRLTIEQAAMTDSGWACPSCFRAWTMKTHPQFLKEQRSFRVPPKLLLPLIILAVVLFALGTYLELRRLNGMNNVIRQHLPRE